MKYLLEVSGLTAVYDGNPIVRGISLCLQDGEVVALLGSNGAGKSTLLKAIAGLVPAVAGRIVFDGADLGGMEVHHRARRGLALVPEGRRLFSELTVMENLRTGALARNGRSDERVDLERVYSLFPILAAKGPQLAASLSGGEQQMLALGRALMSAPRLLMIDEPSLGLSPIAAGALYQTIATLAASGMTIIVAEQNLRLALRVAGRTYVLRHGEVVFAGGTAELHARSDLPELYLGKSPALKEHA